MVYRADYKHPGFAAVSQHFYNELISRNPVTATRLGEHAFDGLLPETGAETIERNIAFYRDLKTAFSALPENELSLDERIDRESMIQFASQQLFWEEDLQRWQLGRDLAMCIGDAIFLLFIRDFAPLSDRVQSMILRLKAVPMFLMSGKTLFQKVPQIWGETFLESAHQLPIFLDTIETSIRRYVPAILHHEFSRAVLEAKKALAEFSNWFKHAIMPRADADWSLGHGAFQALLATRKLGLTQEEILDLGRQSLQDSATRLENLGCIILGVATGMTAGARLEAQKRIKSHGPASFEQTLGVYREAVNRSRAFIEFSEFATLPDNEELEIIETPDYMRHLIPATAYFGPERKSVTQRGFYLLTRETAGKSERHNYADIANAVIHEGYPGHHLQLAALNRHPGIMRGFSDNLEIIEGWACYCQEAVRESGFETSAESLFSQSTEAVLTAARLITDINLQTRQWNFDQAVNYLMEQAKIDKVSAIIEVKRQTQQPGSNLGGLVGLHFLHELKADLKQKFASDFTDRNFHDLILYEGGAPVNVARDFFSDLVRHNIKARNGF